MGLSGISFWQLLIILVIVVLLFGTKRLGSLGSDLGKMIKGFKSSMNEGEDDKTEQKDETPQAVEDKNKAGSSTSNEKAEHKH